MVLTFFLHALEQLSVSGDRFAIHLFFFFYSSSLVFSLNMKLFNLFQSHFGLRQGVNFFPFSSN